MEGVLDQDHQQEGYKGWLNQLPKAFNGLDSKQTVWQEYKKKWRSKKKH